MKIVVFLGPSLPVADARRVLDAVYLPPARQSDLLSAIGTYRPDVVALIDGEFGQSLSVWHKEILYALTQGVAVYGASSMGALRAAETSAYGMIGVGEVYRQFASGALTDDDEVALAHGQDEDGYRALSEPMVNLRATLAAARDAGIVDAAVHDALVAVAKRTFFADRSFPQVLRDARAQGIDPDALERMRVFSREHYVDLKRADALALLGLLHAQGSDVPRPSADFTFNRSFLFEAQYQRDRTMRHAGIDVPLASIADHAALTLPDFNALNEAALNRTLVDALADMLEVSVEPAEIDEEGRRFALRQRLATPAALADWQARNDLTAAEFRDMMHAQARARALYRWLMIRRFMERSTRPVLNELRLTGAYERVARAAALEAHLVEGRDEQLGQRDLETLPTLQLAVEHMRTTGCRMDTGLAAWSEEAGFHSVDDLRLALLRARLARQLTAAHTRDAAEALLGEQPAAAAAG